MRARLVAVIAFAAVSVFGGGAWADEERYPIAIVDRTLLLPPLGVEIEASGALGREPAGPVDASYGGARIAAGIGLFGFLEIDASPGHVVSDATVTQVGDPWIAVTAMPLERDIELGGQLQTTLLQPNIGADGYATTSTGVLFEPAIPFRLHLGHVAKIAVTPTLELAVGAAPARPGAPVTHVRVGVAVPIGVRVQFTKVLSGSIQSGVAILRFDTIPLPVDVPFAVGPTLTVPGRFGPLLDFTPSFGLPYLLLPGLQPASRTDLWQLSCDVAVYAFP